MATLRDARLTGPGAANLVAAHATLDDLRHVRRVADQLRDEKDRLYRTLRKMNMLTPVPVVGVVRDGAPGARATRPVLDELVERGIVLHRTPQPELDAHARISAVSHDATAALRAALIDLAADL
jgi:histidinol-phosphate/aromatic aminotransferase/cobyric acid decarboxylase-like protein